MRLRLLVVALSAMWFPSTIALAQTSGAVYSRLDSLRPPETKIERPAPIGFAGWDCLAPAFAGGSIPFLGCPYTNAQKESRRTESIKVHQRVKIGGMEFVNFSIVDRLDGAQYPVNMDFWVAMEQRTIWSMVQTYPFQNQGRIVKTRLEFLDGKPVKWSASGAPEVVR